MLPETNRKRIFFKSAHCERANVKYRDWRMKMNVYRKKNILEIQRMFQK